MVQSLGLSIRMLVTSYILSIKIKRKQLNSLRDSRRGDCRLEKHHFGTFQTQPMPGANQNELDRIQSNRIKSLQSYGSGQASPKGAPVPGHGFIHNQSERIESNPIESDQIGTRIQSNRIKSVKAMVRDMRSQKDRMSRATV